MPEALRKKYLESIEQISSSSGSNAASNYLDWIRSRLGSRISEKYMIPYNRKIWGVEPEEMDVDWLEKIPNLSVDEIRKTIEEKLSSHEKFPSHQTFYYPKEGGFQKIFDAICEPVNDSIRFNTAINDIHHDGEYWCINSELSARHIINTAPWPGLRTALKPPQSLDEHFERLRYNSIVVSLIEDNYDHDYHWLYEPDMQLNHHREFFIHNFAPHSKDTGIYLETNTKRWEKGAAVGKYNKVPLHEHVNEVAYPIPSIGHTSAITAIRDYYTPKGFHSVGRWGQWKYLNSDVCIWEAMQFIKSLLNN